MCGSKKIPVPVHFQNSQYIAGKEGYICHQENIEEGSKHTGV